MNNKGFTLIELLAVILLLALITAVAFPMVGDMLKVSKNKSYDILISNINTAAKTFFEECKYNNDNNSNNVCQSEYKNSPNSPTISLQQLVNYGFLDSKDLKDPRGTIANMKNCTVTISMPTQISYNVRYNGNCSSIGTKVVK